MTKPIIGITLDVEDPGGYSKFPWYALRKNYIDSVEQVRGIALPLGHNLDNIDSYMSIIDGLIITGGNYDISPKLYGEKATIDYNEKTVHIDKKPDSENQEDFFLKITEIAFHHESIEIEEENLAKISKALFSLLRLNGCFIPS